MNLGTKLIVSLVAVIVLIMTVHGYLSIQQDQESIKRELSVGMRGFSRVLQAGLSRTLADKLDLKETQQFIDTAAPRGNIHGIIVYDLSGKPVAHSASMVRDDFQSWIRIPIAKLDPRPVLQSGNGIDGYIHEHRNLIYYRMKRLSTLAISLSERSCSLVKDTQPSPPLSSGATEFWRQRPC
jgi:hypothetical protein